MIDYEQAFIQAIKQVFPNTDISGCLFYYSQCIWSSIQICGLQKNHSSDITMALELRKLMSLAFFPSDDVVDAFELLISSRYYDENEELLSDIITYWENTWIGRHSRSGR